MTNEEINKAIAEHLGWMAHPTCKRVWRTPEQARRNKSLIGTVNGPWSTESSGPPNYAEDLNAMHEAEKTLDDHEHDRMRNQLWLLMIKTTERNKTSRRVHSAEARERAEALLRTIGKWKENE